MKDHVQLGHGGLVDIQLKTKHRVSLGATAGNLLQLARSLDMHYVKPLASPFGVFCAAATGNDGEVRPSWPWRLVTSTSEAAPLREWLGDWVAEAPCGEHGTPHVTLFWHDEGMDTSQTFVFFKVFQPWKKLREEQLVLRWCSYGEQSEGSLKQELASILGKSPYKGFGYDADIRVWRETGPNHAPTWTELVIDGAMNRWSHLAVQHGDVLVLQYHFKGLQNNVLTAPEWIKQSSSGKLLITSPRSSKRSGEVRTEHQRPHSALSMYATVRGEHIRPHSSAGVHSTRPVGSVRG